MAGTREKPKAPLAELMDRRGISIKQLAAKTRISERTIARYRSEGSDTTPRGRTLEALAKALEVQPAVLTGQAPLPPDDGRDGRNPEFLVRLTVSLSPAVRNALSLVAMRYRVPESRVVAFAPWLFLLLAEKSLSERREAVAAVRQAAQRLEECGRQVAHLPAPMVMPDSYLDDALAVEERSIEAHDVFGELVWAHEDAGMWPSADDQDRDPFDNTLRRMAEQLGVDAAIAPRGLNDLAAFQFESWDICSMERQMIAGGDAELELALRRGRVLIRDIPRQLLLPLVEVTGERQQWIRDRLSSGPQPTVDDLFEDTLGSKNQADGGQGHG